jgi:hypothetical protein
MPQALKAIYRNGALILQTAFELPESDLSLVVMNLKEAKNANQC